MTMIARKLGLAFVAVAMLDAAGLAVLPAAAQMDWLTPHLQNQRHDNIRRHQQRLQQKRVGPRMAAPHASVVTPKPDPARMAAHRRRLEPEYNRRVKFYGREAANRWLKKKAYEIGVAEGRRARRLGQ